MKHANLMLMLKRSTRVILFAVLLLSTVLGQTFLSAILTASVHKVYAAGNIYHVAKNGSNSNPGTPAKPWLTVDYAASTAVAGDTVIIHAGIYNERVTFDRSGSAGNWITFMKAEGEDRPVIDGMGISLGATALVYAYEKDYIKLVGLEVCNAWYSGSQPTPTMTYHSSGNPACMYFRRSSHIWVENCYMHHADAQGVEFQGYSDDWQTDITIKNCETAYTNYRGSQ